MVREIRIYVEGGGKGSDSRAAVRVMAQMVEAWLVADPDALATF